MVAVVRGFGGSFTLGFNAGLESGFKVIQRRREARERRALSNFLNGIDQQRLRDDPNHILEIFSGIAANSDLSPRARLSALSALQRFRTAQSQSASLNGLPDPFSNNVIQGQTSTIDPGALLPPGQASQEPDRVIPFQESTGQIQEVDVEDVAADPLGTSNKTAPRLNIIPAADASVPAGATPGINPNGQTPGVSSALNNAVSNLLQTPLPDNGGVLFNGDREQAINQFSSLLRDRGLDPSTVTEQQILALRNL